MTPTTMTTAEQIASLIGVVAGDPAGITEFRLIDRAMPEGHAKKSIGDFCRFDELEQLAAHLTTMNGAGRDIYYAVNPKSRRKRGNENVAAAWCLFADFDGNPTLDDVNARIDAALIPPPSAMLASAHGYHAYWRFDEPCTDMAHWTEMQKDLIFTVGSDTVIHNPERIMRLPGFRNLKPPEGDAELIFADASRVYEWGDVLSCLRERPAERQAPATPTDGTSDKENVRLATVSMMMVETPDGNDGSKRVFTYCCRGVEFALSDPDIIRAIRSATALRPLPRPWNDGEIIRRIRDAEKKTQRGKAAVCSAVNQAVLVRMSDVEAKAVEWLWFETFGLGKVSAVVGDPGLGKSTAMLEIAGRITKGANMPDGNPGRMGSVILLTAEDGLADTVRPRLDKAGADVSKVHVLQAARVGNGKERSVTLADVPTLRSAIDEVGDVIAVVVDPVGAYYGEKDSHKDADVRSLIAPLTALAEEKNIAVILVGHLSKGGGSTKAVYRAMGSLGLIAASRAAYMFTKDPANPNRRMMLPIKNNIGNDRRGFAYGFPNGQFKWESGSFDMTADDCIAEEDNGRGPKPEKREDAVAWLRDLLKDGSMFVEKIKKEAKDAGQNWFTVKRAKPFAGVKSEKCTYTQGWQWRLLHPGNMPDDEGEQKGEQA